jgi:hypothetical protein
VGKHSHRSQWAFYRSVLGWAFPWLIVSAMVAVGIWLAVDALGNDDIDTPVVAETSESASPSAEAPSKSPRPEPSPSPSPSVDDAEPSAPPEVEVELITEDMSVQVLNGTADAAADDRMANQLSELGFEVVAIQGASRAYEMTTVLWSYTESREAAERLAERFGWQVEPKPENLSTTVALHVVVGSDY